MSQPPKPNKHNHSHGVSQPTARNTQPTQSWHTQLRQSTSTIATLFVYACTLTEHMPPYPTHMVFDVVRDSGYVCFSPRAVGAVVAHFPDTEGVTSSNLVSPTRLHTVHCLCGHSLVGKARPCQGRDRGFESRCPLSSYSSRFPPHAKGIFHGGHRVLADLNAVNESVGQTRCAYCRVHVRSCPSNPGLIH